MSAVKLWRLCAGHFRVRRVPGSPVFHTCAQLPPHHVEVMLAVPWSIPGTNTMKKITPDPPIASSDCESLNLEQLSETSQRAVSKRLRNPNHADPVCHVFTIVPNVDIETLLCHACETLASLNVLTTDLACKLEGSPRSLALAIQQMAVVGELLVNRALDSVDPPAGI
jgi:hypothetical protein